MLPPKKRKTITGNTLSLPMLVDLLKLRSPEFYSESRQYYASRSQPSPTKLPGGRRQARDHLAWLRPDEFCGRYQKCGGKSPTRKVLRQVRYGTYMSKRYFTCITDNSVDGRFLSDFGTSYHRDEIGPFY